MTIALCIVGYFAIAAAVTFVASRAGFDRARGDSPILLGAFWPLALLFAVLALPFLALERVAEWGRR